MNPSTAWLLFMAATSAWWVVTNGMIASYAGKQQEKLATSTATLLDSLSGVTTDAFRTLLRRHSVALVPVPDHIMALRWFKSVTFGFVLPAGVLNIIILIGEYQAQINKLDAAARAYSVTLAVCSVLLSVLTGIVILVFSISFEAWAALKELALWNTIRPLVAGAKSTQAEGRSDPQQGSGGSAAEDVTQRNDEHRNGESASDQRAAR